MNDPVTTLAKQPTRDDAALALRIVHGFLNVSRPVWTNERPKVPGYYWLRDGARIDRPYVVEVLQDWSEKDVPLVVQEYRPEDIGVEYLRSTAYDDCLWAGPIEQPDER